MKISLITPAKKHSRAGNRATAMRWARILRDLGHRVKVAVSYDGAACDLMIALHAWRSAQSVTEFRARHPEGKLVVALTGTDIYRFIESDRTVTLRSMDAADLLVGLHDLVAEALPDYLRAGVRVVYQSAPPLPRARAPSKRHFEILVIGHLRDEKDPFRAALAVRELPEDSRIRVTHLGQEHEPRWAVEARAEAARNPRYRWLGEVPGAEVRRRMGTAHLMVLSSRMEGGANVLSEAMVAGLPTVASDIPGSVGLLGREYPGFYPVEDTAALRAQLLRAEGEPAFLESLRRHGESRAPLFAPAREAESWRRILEELGG